MRFFFGYVLIFNAHFKVFYEFVTEANAKIVKGQAHIALQVARDPKSSIIAIITA